MQIETLMQPASSATIAFVTTIHLALSLLRQHRSARRFSQAPILVPSLLLMASPWLLATPVWLVGALLTHIGWFVACERMLLPAAPRAVATAAPLSATTHHSRAEPMRANGGFSPAPVLAVLEETADIRTFRILRPDGFTFLAGQFLNVRVKVDGKPLVRCYSISSAPESAGCLEISVKRQGVVSNLLHASIRPGSVLTIKGAGGRFVYPDEDDRPLVLLGGGVGVTPLISMLRHAVAADPARPVTLLLSARTEADIPFKDELATIRIRHPQVRLGLRTSRRAGGPGTTTGRIDEEYLRSHVPDPANSVFMICGPLQMIEGMKTLLQRVGARAEDVRSEAFEAAVAASQDRAELARVIPIDAAARLSLTLAVTGRSVPVGRGQSLLEACEAGGVHTIPSSCRAGMCMTCRTRLVRGSVDCSSDSLDAEDRAAGYVLPCVAWPKTDCVLEA
jgi:glycine betaine catabolism B